MIQTQPTFIQVLQPYKELIENNLKQSIEQLGPKNTLRDACEYALMNGGKRFRPVLVMMIAKAINPLANVMQAALGIEFFHTASLIADDLPCMDNDLERREKPTLHLVYGESTALLASYALISAGYSCLAKNTQELAASDLSHAHQSDHLCFLALENVSQNTSLCTDGQFLDLDPPSLSLEQVRQIIYKKTITLFEISFVLGWLFGGGKPALQDEVKKCAYHFGMAFQVADDLNDMEQDLSNKHSLNCANLFGKEFALRMFWEEMYQFNQKLVALNLHDSDLSKLANLLVVK